MRFFGMTFTTSARRPPGRATSGEIDAVKLRCGVFRATMTSAATGPASRASRAAASVSAVIRLKPDSTLRCKRLLDLLFEADFIARIEAVLFRQNLTTGIQQVMRRRHPDLVLVRRRAAAEQHRHRVPVLRAPLRD